MTRDPTSFKNVAVLTGLTALIGGAEISNADAATMMTPPQTDTFSFSPVTFPTNHTLMFNGFDTSLGTLTGVSVELNSQFTMFALFTGAAGVDVSATLGGQSIVASTAVTANGKFDPSIATITTSLGSFVGGPNSVSAVLSIFALDGFVTWSSGPDTPAGLTVTYDYTTPLPPTLLSLASGLAGLGFMTWRSRRKQTATK